MGPVDEIVLDDSLAPETKLALFSQFSPRVRTRVVDRSGIKRVLRDRTVHVIMSERDIVPAVRAELLEGDLHRRSIQLAPILGKYALDLAVQEKNVVLGRGIRFQTWFHLRHVRYRQNSQIES